MLMLILILVLILKLTTLLLLLLLLLLCSPGSRRFFAGGTDSLRVHAAFAGANAGIPSMFFAADAMGVGARK